MSWSACALLIIIIRGPRYLVYVGCSNFRYTNNNQNKFLTQRHQQKKWSKEVNKNVLHSYFESNPTQRMYRKRIIEIWANSARFNTTSQRPANPARMILKKGCLFDLQMLEIRVQNNLLRISTRSSDSNQNTKYGKAEVPEPNWKSKF